MVNNDRCPDCGERECCCDLMAMLDDGGVGHSLDEFLTELDKLDAGEESCGIVGEK